MRLVVNFAFVLSILLTCLVVIEFFGSKIISSTEFNDKINITDEAIEFYKTHSAELHHLRDLDDDRWHLSENPSNALFTIIAPFLNTQKNILIQGDSWAEQFDLPASREYLERFANEKQVGIINAGSTSYAPSVMAVQINKLRRQFDIHPEHIVAIIDQTDIGDELCRYAIRRNFDDANRLIGIRPEPFESNETYKLELFFRKQAILRSDKMALQKFLESAVLKIQHNFRKEKRRCKWPEISRPLTQGISKEEAEDFISAVDRYIEAVFSDGRVKSLHIIVHPHSNHFSQDIQDRYVLYAGELIQQAIHSNKHENKIVLLDFLNQNIGSYLDRPTEEIFKEGDPSSHLNDQIFASELTPRIFQELAKRL